MSVLERVGADEYSRIFPRPSHVFNSVAFNELNRGKCDDIHYLILRDDNSKPRLGIILGERDGWLLSPFSAPFGGAEQTRSQRVEFYLDLVDALTAYSRARGMKVRITLPPYFYDSDGNVSKFYCALLTRGVRLQHTEYNYHYLSSSFSGYEADLASDDRKKFRKSSRSGFSLEVLSNTPENIARAYSVIKANRESHGYPLRMSLQDVIDTAKIVDATFMVLSHNGSDVAAAQAYDVSPQVAQIIYWGDVPGYSALLPMRYLPYKVFEYFHERKAVVDVGPSSIDGDPSVGLCDFKEEIGCRLSPRPTLVFG